MQIIDKIEREKPETTAAKLARIRRHAAKNWTRSSPGRWPNWAARCPPLEADLSARGLRDFVEFDPRIVRGLAYYTGVVFEVFDRAQKSRALAGGGRYDEFIGLLSDGAVKHPALGFAVGDVTLLDLLRALPHTAAILEAATRVSAAPQVYGIIADESCRAHALASIQALRAVGLRVDFALTAAKVGKQFQAAESAGAPLAVIYGAEWPMVKVKHLARREENAVRHEELLEVLGSALGDVSGRRDHKTHVH